MKTKNVNRFLQTLAITLAVLCVVLGAVYVTFDILDEFNPMLHFLNSNNFFLRHLDKIVGILAFLLGIVTTIRVGKAWNSQYKRDKEQ
ncbi:MAG TPA: hypothetical protein P5116_08480 [Eubacteriales bacterium]|nr:hypothetical protein [Clostridia bacterium]HRV73894.1 hypothetical protein [Eubacteriales bacterium]